MAAGHAHVPHMNPEVFRELLLDLDGAPLQVWQGFSPGSLASYEKNITDLFLELQISDGQPYFEKFAPKVPDAQNHTARDEARLRISSQSFSNVDAIKSELDQYFSIHHPGCCGLQRENSLGGKRAVFRCTSVLQKSKAEQKQPAAAPADYKEECALFLPFRKGGQRGGVLRRRVTRIFHTGRCRSNRREGVFWGMRLCGSIALFVFNSFLCSRQSSSKVTL
jgi:hypothetical protein